MTSKLVMMWQEFTATTSNALKQKPLQSVALFFDLNEQSGLAKLKGRIVIEY